MQPRALDRQREPEVALERGQLVVERAECGEILELLDPCHSLPIERERRPRDERVSLSTRLMRNATDLRRGLDSVTSRPDLDATRIAFYGPSAGSSIGMIVTAIDPRYRAVAMSGVGMTPPDRGPSYGRAGSRHGFC